MCGARSIYGKIGASAENALHAHENVIGDGGIQWRGGRGCVYDGVLRKGRPRSDGEEVVRKCGVW